MKLYIITLVLFVVSSLCIGQQINRAEYFIGVDPGFGLATPIVISTPGEELSLDFTTDIQTLSEGFHFINIRARDDLGKWGHPAQRLFYVFKTQSNIDKAITDIEYFIDIDPGFGLATPVIVSSPGNIITLDFTAVIESLTEGFHFLNVRARDDLGKWGHPIQRIFYVFRSQSAADREITGIEYFIDTDPGFGKATPVEVPSPGNEITINFDVDISSLSDGDHILYVRCKDALNRWGQMQSQGFTFTITNVGVIKIESLFKLYPNPGNGDFYIEFSEEQNRQAMLTIEDLNGKTVHMEELYNRVNLLHLNLLSGLYLVNLRLKDKNYQQKIIMK